MTTASINKTNNSVDTVHEVQSFALKIGLGASLLIGIWGVTCLCSALFTGGISSVVSGYLLAVGAL